MNIQIIVNDTHHDKCFRELVNQPVTVLRNVSQQQADALRSASTPSRNWPISSW